jgi:hypothetical protein
MPFNILHISGFFISSHRTPKKQQRHVGKRRVGGSQATGGYCIITRYAWEESQKGTFEKYFGTTSHHKLLELPSGKLT